jgi:hypothetical protein
MRFMSQEFYENATGTTTSGSASAVRCDQLVFQLVAIEDQRVGSMFT